MDTITQLRQTLTQFLYSHYEILSKQYSEDEAKEITFQVAEELLAPFVKKGAGQISYYSLLNDWKEEWENKEKESIKKKDYELQEKALDILNGINILIPYAKEKDGDLNV